MPNEITLNIFFRPRTGPNRKNTDQSGFWVHQWVLPDPSSLRIVIGACLVVKVILSFGIPHSGSVFAVVLVVGAGVDCVVETGDGDAVDAEVDAGVDAEVDFVVVGAVVEGVVAVVVVMVVGFTEQYHLSK